MDSAWVDMRVESESESERQTRPPQGTPKSASISEARFDAVYCERE